MPWVYTLDPDLYLRRRYADAPTRAAAAAALLNGADRLLATAREERIDLMIQRKRQLFEEVVAPTENVLRSLSRSELAELIQRELGEAIGIRNRGVKQAGLIVLKGCRMPAVLVETSFISNPRECKRLINPQYQERLSESIVTGIKTYIKETTPTAFFNVHPASGTGG